MFIFSAMNEIRCFFSDDEMVVFLRELGAVVEERRVTRWMNEESYQAWVWQVKKSDGSWTDAAPVFKELAGVAVKRSITGNVNVLDLLNVLK